MIKTCMDNVREKAPLVHNITNYVTVNDVANVLLACGGSPIMSDEPDDVEDITSICVGLNINIGTLNKRTIESMFLAGKKSKALGHVLLLDPVGAGASKLRTETAVKILDELKPDVIRGNISEIKTLALGSGTTKGVDADVADAVTESTLDNAVAFAKNFAAKTGSIIAITGAIDLVADAENCYVIRNGRAEMGYHRNGMPAFRHDDGVPCSKPGKQAGCGSCSGVRYGTCRRDRLEPHGRRRWEFNVS